MHEYTPESDSVTAGKTRLPPGRIWGGDEDGRDEGVIGWPFFFQRMRTTEMID
jgi:hypothetical protein